VKYDELPVTCELNVKLSPVIACPRRFAERMKRVLGPQSGAAAMRDVQRFHRTDL
jgi:hypothetical protein